MIIAEQKKKENIAEYLIYMYQVEDMIRANSLDIRLIEQNIINSFEVPYALKREMYEWYRDLADRMINEKKQKKGHMDFLNELVSDLTILNNEQLKDPLSIEYRETYNRAMIQVDELRKKAGPGQESNIQLALNGLYGLLILKLKKSKISKETLKAFEDISEWIGLLSQEYMKKNS